MGTGPIFKSRNFIGVLDKEEREGRYLYKLFKIAAPPGRCAVGAPFPYERNKGIWKEIIFFEVVHMRP